MKRFNIRNASLQIEKIHTVFRTVQGTELNELSSVLYQVLYQVLYCECFCTVPVQYSVLQVLLHCCTVAVQSDEVFFRYSRSYWMTHC